MVELRYVTWDEYGRISESLALQLINSGRKFDLVVGIARGGIPLAMVIADRLGLRLDIVNVKSYTSVQERKKPVILSTLTEKIEGKEILLVDDLVDQGDTMETVISFLRENGAGRIATAVLFKKPWSKFIPDFYVETTSSWVVFPWEREEVRRIMMQSEGQKVQEV